MLKLRTGEARCVQTQLGKSIPGGEKGQGKGLEPEMIGWEQKEDSGVP